MVSIFDFIYEKYKITKPIRLIELFSGYGSQALALKYLGVDFEHYKTCEWAVKSIKAYNDLHMPKVKASASAKQLYDLGISMDYNKPMTLDQIERKGQEWWDDVYSSIVATNDLVDISRAHIELPDKDKYTYLMTYSFPCQDLSLAGKRAGMGEGTRSGLLSQVERILREGALPDILLMENVPQVITEDGFKNWILFLESKGYTSYYKILNAKDFGIPQNRKRCFMVSILGGYNYSFPNKMKLKLKLKDLLEKDVDEKYYLTTRGDCFGVVVNVGNYSPSGHNAASVVDPSGIAPTVMENHSTVTAIAIKNATKQGYLMAEEGDGVDISGRMEYHRGTVQKGLCQTIKTTGDVGVVVKESYSDLEKSLFTEDGNIKRYLDSDIVDEFKDGQMATTSYPNGYGHGTRVHNESIALTVNERPSVKVDLRIRKLTPKECWRLMGVKDEDFEKVNQSNNSLYHLAGDSIVTTVLMGIFGELWGIDYQAKIEDLIKNLKKL